MRTSPEINEIGAALAKAQSAMTVAVFDSKNPAFKSNYASLSSVVAAIRVPLTNNGIAFLQSVSDEPAGIRVVTRLIHSSGQWIESDGPMIPVDKANAHGAMSATTYAKRGSLSLALSLPSDEDDDGNAAAHTKPPAVSSPEFDAWRTSIEQADAAALADIASELATSTMPASDKARLRAAYAARKHALAAA